MKKISKTTINKVLIIIGSLIISYSYDMIAPFGLALICVGLGSLVFGYDRYERYERD